MLFEYFGYACAALMGTVLGITGAGGSILSVPILVYIFNKPPVVATAYSLFVVGVAAGFGAKNYWLRGLIDIKTGVSFGVPSFLGVYVARAALVPSIPDPLMSIGDFSLSKNLCIMLVFSAIMIFAALSMIRGRTNAEKKPQPGAGIILAQGLFIGLLSGIIGIGGGFLVVPVLVILIGLEMKVAVGTTLFIVMIKSLFGFVGDIQNGLEIEWSFLFLFSGLAVAGIYLGNYLSKYISGPLLKPIFGWFVLIMGIGMLADNILGLF